MKQTKLDTVDLKNRICIIAERRAFLKGLSMREICDDPFQLEVYWTDGGQIAYIVFNGNVATIYVPDKQVNTSSISGFDVYSIMRVSNKPNVIERDRLAIWIVSTIEQIIDFRCLYSPRPGFIYQYRPLQKKTEKESHGVYTVKDVHINENNIQMVQFEETDTEYPITDFYPLSLDKGFVLISDGECEIPKDKQI